MGSFWNFPNAAGIMSKKDKEEFGRGMDRCRNIQEAKGIVDRGKFAEKLLAALVKDCRRAGVGQKFSKQLNRVEKFLKEVPE
jgi:hypothetical protein